MAGLFGESRQRERKGLDMTNGSVVAGEPKKVEMVYQEALTLEEEAEFLRLVNEAEARGEITPQEASAMIDREYELLNQAKAA
jgi:hypothetical protein